jgi:S-(hydroxymethyl)glutathione dehydrogenase / alcohol dehydrogenase
VSTEPSAVRAAVLREPGRPVEIETIRLDPPRAGEVQVRVAAAGVCHSDVHLADGVLGADRWPMVLGHEGAGVVEAVAPDVTHVAPGDRVAFCFVPSCGHCPQCRAGRTTLCEIVAVNMARGTLMDGSSRLHGFAGDTLQHGLMVACFAERCVIDAASAVPIPDALPLWQAALLGCAVVTGVGAVRNVARVRIGETACVIGCGGVGLQVIAGLVLSGASQIIAVDRDVSKLELARARGATDGVLSGPNVAREIRQL